MDDNTPDRRKRWGVPAALLVGGMIGGGALAGTLSASAGTTPAATTQSSAAATAAAGSSTAPQPGGALPVRGDEKSVSAAVAAKLRAAALKAVSGGTVYRIETDAGDATYEAHMRKADGSLVTVKFDKNLAVTKVEAGMGLGDPAPAGGGPGGYGQPGGAAPGGSTTTG